MSIDCQMITQRKNFAQEVNFVETSERILEHRNTFLFYRRKSPYDSLYSNARSNMNFCATFVSIAKLPIWFFLVFDDPFGPTDRVAAILALDETLMMTMVIDWTRSL